MISDAKFLEKSRPVSGGEKHRLQAWRIALVYGIWAGLWVVFSDHLVNLMGLPILHTVKGLGFVVVTTTALYVYLSRKSRLQAALEQSLYAADECKNRLISSVSHDLRQPLQSISLFRSIVQTDPHLGPQSRTALEMLDQTVESMGKLLSAILDLAQADQGGRLTTVSLNTTFNALAMEMEPQANAKGLSLRWVPTSVKVESDPVLLHTILRNLITNAIRYTQSGGRVLVGCRRHKADWEICVYDTGEGIDGDKLELVFEEFYQVGNSSRDSRLGLGLGLSIVKRLAQRLGHRVTVRSRRGKGSAFCILVERPRPQPSPRLTQSRLIWLISRVSQSRLVPRWW